MIILSFFRSVKFALQNFWRNIWLSLVTVIILVLTLLFVSLLSGVNLLADQAIQVVKSKVDVTVYFVPEASEEQILSAKEFVEKFPEVKELTYVSQSEALLQFKEQHTDDEDIIASLAELDQNPLPASFVIKAKELSQYKTIIDKIASSTYAEIVLSQDFEDSQEIISRISQFSDTFTKVGLGVSAVFAIISFLVAFNTFRVAIYSHKEELGIMKLVGATNWFVRGPFFLESFIYAFVSSVITTATLYPISIVLSPYVNDFFEGYTFDFLTFFIDHIFEIFLIQLVVALVLSALSSMFAITRYLKV